MVVAEPDKNYARNHLEIFSQLAEYRKLSGKRFDAYAGIYEKKYSNMEAWHNELKRRLNELKQLK